MWVSVAAAALSAEAVRGTARGSLRQPCRQLRLCSVWSANKFCAWTHDQWRHHLPATAAVTTSEEGEDPPGSYAQGLTLGDSELREYTHGMFGHIARMLGPGFQPYLRAAVAAAVESCGQARWPSPPPRVHLCRS